MASYGNDVTPVVHHSRTFQGPDIDDSFPDDPAMPSVQAQEPSGPVLDGVKLVDLELFDDTGSQPSSHDTDAALSALRAFEELPSLAAFETDPTPTRRSTRKRTSNVRLVDLGTLQLPADAVPEDQQTRPCPVSEVELPAQAPPTAPSLPPLGSAATDHVLELLHAGGDETRSVAAESREGGPATSAVQQAIDGLSKPESFLRRQREDFRLGQVLRSGAPLSRSEALKLFPIGYRFARDFGGGLKMQGVVFDYFDSYWKVRYGDQDWEDLTRGLPPSEAPGQIRICAPAAPVITSAGTHRTAPPRMPKRPTAGEDLPGPTADSLSTRRNWANYVAKSPCYARSETRQAPGGPTGGPGPGGPAVAPASDPPGPAYIPPSSAAGGFPNAGGPFNHPGPWSGGALYMVPPGGGFLGGGAVNPGGVFAHGGLSPAAPGLDGGLWAPHKGSLGAGVHGIHSMDSGGMYGLGGVAAGGGVVLGGLHMPAAEAMANMVQKSIEVTKHLFDTVYNLQNLNPSRRPRPESPTSSTTWKRGVDMAAEHEARHFKASRSPRPRTRKVAKLREDLEAFFVSASNLARSASQQFTMPPSTIGNFPLVFPNWTTFQGGVASGGLDNAVDYGPATKASGGGGFSKRSVKSGQCRDTAEECPHDPCRFGHGAPRTKRKADGGAPTGNAKRQSNQGGRRTGNTADGSAAAPSAATTRPKKKGRAANQQVEVEDGEAIDE
eukprot:g17168.t1